MTSITVEPEVWDRYITKVAMAAPDECWEWTAARNRRGYGRFNYRGKNRHAHRLALEFRGVEIPDGMLALHSCDNPPCVNPAHLRVGTYADNAADMMERGRNHPIEPGVGENNSFARLTESEVLAIRRMHASGVRQMHIADAFGISRSLVWTIVHRISWTHLDESEAS